MNERTHGETRNIIENKHGIPRRYRTLASENGTGNPQCAKEHEHIVGNRSRTAWTISSTFQSKEYQTEVAWLVL